MLEEFLAQYQWQSIVIVSAIFTLISILFYYHQDKYEPEPKSQIILAFLGGILSAIIALIVSLIVIEVGLLIGLNFISSIGFSAVIIAPLIEEICKGSILLLFSNTKSFDGPLDGIVYGAMIGSGFAFAENILYGFFYSQDSGLLGLGVTAFRGLTQIVGHPLYTAVFGLGVGAAKVGLYPSKYQELWKAMLLHASWNLSSIIFIPGILIVLGIGVYLLRKKLQFAINLDRIAYESGYYDRKKNDNTIQTIGTPNPPRQGIPLSNRWGRWLQEPKPWDTIMDYRK